MPGSDKKILTEREKTVHALAKKLGVTRAHASDLLRQEENENKDSSKTPRRESAKTIQE